VFQPTWVSDAPVVPQTTAALQKVESLGRDFVRYESCIKATEETLAKLKELYGRIAEHELPRAMDAAGVSEFRMPGARITLARDPGTGMRKARRSDTIDYRARLDQSSTFRNRQADTRLQLSRSEAGLSTRQ
jgi:hypothetical protein